MRHYPCLAIILTVRKHGTSIGGQFDWGGTLLKRYQEGPKISSSGSEIRCRVQGQKLVLLESYKQGFQSRNSGLANHHVLLDGGW